MRFPSGAAIAAFFLFPGFHGFFRKKTESATFYVTPLSFMRLLYTLLSGLSRGFLKKISVFFRPSGFFTIDKFHVLTV